MLSEVSFGNRSKGAVLTPKRLFITVGPHVDSKVSCEKGDDEAIRV